jgi:hypothetical protein
MMMVGWRTGVAGVAIAAFGFAVEWNTRPVAFGVLNDYRRPYCVALPSY